MGSQGNTKSLYDGIRGSPVVLESKGEYYSLGDFGYEAGFPLLIRSTTSVSTNAEPEYWLQPDIYDTVITLVSDSGCSTQWFSNLTYCNLRRGGTFSETSAESIPLTDSSILSNSLRRDSINKFWGRIHNTKDVMPQASLIEDANVWDFTGTSWKISNQSVRLTSALDPFVGTIGLGIYEKSFAPTAASFLQNLVATAHIPS